MDKQFKPTDKGGYTQLEVAFKNLSSGKLESKKIMSFSKPESVYQALADAKQNDVFDVTSEKNAKSGYWDWVGINQQAPGAIGEEKQTNMKTTSATPVARSTYETPEERAKKQVYIVRQSSISSAIELLNTGAKSPVKVDEVLKVAQQFTDFVFGNDPKGNDLFLQPNDLPDMGAEVQ